MLQEVVSLPFLYPQLLLCAAKHTLFTIFLHYKAALDICVWHAGHRPRFVIQKPLFSLWRHTRITFATPQSKRHRL